MPCPCKQQQKRRPCNKNNTPARLPSCCKSSHSLVHQTALLVRFRPKRGDQTPRPQLLRQAPVCRLLAASRREGWGRVTRCSHAAPRENSTALPPGTQCMQEPRTMVWPRCCHAHHDARSCQDAQKRACSNTAASRPTASMRKETLPGSVPAPPDMWTKWTQFTSGRHCHSSEAPPPPLPPPAVSSHTTDPPHTTCGAQCRHGRGAGAAAP